MPGIFFTSDEHYGHRNIIKYCDRPFADTEEMTERLIENHNKVVRPGDLTYHLGDMFWRTFGDDAAHTVMSRLNGQHFYIFGNHDELMHKSNTLRERFVWTRELVKIHPAGQSKNFGIVLCHFALRVWSGDNKGSWHLYGHSHAGLPENGSRSFDVGVDACAYTPISLEEVAVRMAGKPGTVKPGRHS